MAFSNIDSDNSGFNIMTEDEFGTPRGAHSAPSPLSIDRFDSCSNLEGMRESQEDFDFFDDGEVDLSLDDMLNEVCLLRPD